MRKMTTFLKVGFVIFWFTTLVWILVSEYSEPSRQPSFSITNRTALMDGMNFICNEVSSIAKCSSIDIGGKNQPIASASISVINRTTHDSCDAINRAIGEMTGGSSSSGFHPIKIGEQRIFVKCDNTPSGEQKLIGVLGG